jgi:hypothetical protein
LHTTTDTKAILPPAAWASITLSPSRPCREGPELRCPGLSPSRGYHRQREAITQLSDISLACLVIPDILTQCYRAAAFEFMTPFQSEIGQIDFREIVRWRGIVTRLARLMKIFTGPTLTGWKFCSE